MSKISHKLNRFLSDEDGPTTVEYAIILAVIALTVTASVTLLGDGMRQAFEFISNALS